LIGWGAGPDAVYLLLCCLASELGLTPEALGLSPEDIAAAADSKQPGTG
jgi:hypothetical protein